TRSHRRLVDGDGRLARTLGDQGEAWGAAQEGLGPSLQTAATDPVTSPVPLGCERLEVVRGHLADVADGLSRQRLLRIDPHPVRARHGEDVAVAGHDPAAGRDLAGERERAVLAELREEQLPAPSDLPAGRALAQKEGPRQGDLTEQISRKGEVDR